MNPYEKLYGLKDIKRGLKFYYDFLDDIDPFIYSEKKLSWQRQDILLTLNYLEQSANNTIANSFRYSHPTQTEAIEAIEFYNTNTDKQHISTVKILFYIDELLSSGIHLLFQKEKIDLENNVKQLNHKEAAEYFIKYKYSVENNPDSYSKKFSKLIIEYANIEIEKYKSILSLGEQKQNITITNSMVGDIKQSSDNNIKSTSETQTWSISNTSFVIITGIAIGILVLIFWEQIKHFF